MIAVVNPMSLGVLKPPGLWGDDGVDIACGDEPLGIPMSSGVLRLGLFAVSQNLLGKFQGVSLVRQKI